MPVIHCARDFGGSTFSKNQKGVRDYSLKWIVKTDDPTMSAVAVVNQAISASPHPIPSIFDGYSADPWAYCVDLQANQRQSAPLIWEVTAKFSTQTDTE